MIIDSHTHLSQLKKGGNFQQVKDNLLLNMKKNGINYAIIIPDNIPNTRCADLETVMNLIKNEPRLFMVGTLGINNVNKLELRKIERLFQKKIIRGFKIFPGHDPVYPIAQRWRPVYQLCIKYNLPLIIHTGINTNNNKISKYNDPRYIIEIAKIYPKLKIIIAHYFWPKLDYCFAMTNNIKNIYFDTSVLAHPFVVNKSGGINKIKRILAKTVKRKADSLIFGTDWPIGNMKKHINLIDSLNITEEERKNIYYKNSLKLFSLKNHPSKKISDTPN